MNSSHEPLPPSEKNFSGRSQPSRVLIIDDSNDARRILQLLLTKLGYETKTAENGNEGIQLTRDFRPQVVLCDIMMGGGMSGYDFAAAARKDASLEEVCLVALSGREGAEHEHQAYSAGFDRILKKPVGLNELRSALDSICRTGFEGTDEPSH